MIKYIMVAAALRLFSTCPQMKRFYRLLGNEYGAKGRVQRGLPNYYVDYTKLILGLCEKHQVIQKGDKLLEVGTGWLHWGSIVIRLFYDVEITLFDVWDNRQLEPLKRYFAELAELIDKEIGVVPAQYERSHRLLGAISSASSFDDLYHLLGFQYVLEPNGTLRHFQNESFSAIFSHSVLEHVNRDILSEYIQDFCRLLNPGGYSIHSIDIGDHLYYHSRSVSIKNYLRFSDAVWKHCFENEVQYFNRVQRSEWLSLFHRAGLELVEEESVYSSIGTIEVDKQYENLDRQDLECTELTVVHRKPS